jgi:hypothetical protein
MQPRTKCDPKQQAEMPRAFNAITWSCIRLSSGETTTATRLPLLTSGGSW